MRKLVGPSLISCILIHSASFAAVGLPSPNLLSEDLNRNYYYVDMPRHTLPYYFPPYYIDTPRLFVWGLTGSESLGRVDALVPVVRGHDYFFYTDLQGKVASDNAWLASAGTGYRGLVRDYIWGGYLFLDRNVSERHNVFYVLSPGAEIIHNDWDARVNGYIPVSERRKRGASFFPSGDNQCGEHGDCQFVVFRGHQQFEHRFFNFEEVGPGIDGEVGLNIGRFNNFSIHVGGYYYQFKDKDNIRGAELRLEAPIQPNLALTLEANYDNKDHGAAVAGIRFQLGQTRHSPIPTIADHFYDRVARNLGTINTGSGIITQEGRKDEGLFLRRDNIYFFTATGGTVFTGADSGTFENPLRADQFNSATLASVKTLTGNGNFYFNSGFYSLGATTVVVLENQSLFGRTDDYRCTAEGDDRPILHFTQAGTALIVTGGNNIIDSLIIENQVTGPAAVVALDVEDNSGLHICNSVIDAETTVIGDLAATNSATGIIANNSTVFIDSSIVQAIATVTGNNGGINSAVGIGANVVTAASTPTFTNNNFTLDEVTVIANAIVNGGNTTDNSSVGIGNALGGLFINNNFRITRSFIESNAIVGGTNAGDNAAIGIGDNSINAFSNNNFLIDNALIRAIARINLANLGGDNFAVGIGDADATFNNNLFSLSNTSVQSHAILLSDNTNGGDNIAVGIGDILGTQFVGNIINIDRSEVIAIASVGGGNLLLSSNIAIALGAQDTTTFTDNVFSVHQSYLQASALIGGNNTAGSENLAFGVSATSVNPPNANIFNIDESAFLVEAIVNGTNAGTNVATALFANAATVVNVANSSFNVFALTGGNTGTNDAVSTAGTGTFNITNTTFNLVEN